MKDGWSINLYLFYPCPSGDIESFAIFGEFLEDHLKAIKGTMYAFGWQVKKVFIDREGLSPFVDVYIDNTKMIYP